MDNVAFQEECRSSHTFYQCSTFGCLFLPVDQRIEENLVVKSRPTACVWNRGTLVKPKDHKDHKDPLQWSSQLSSYLLTNSFPFPRTSFISTDIFGIDDG
jgi:hypothetical protein